MSFSSLLYTNVYHEYRFVFVVFYSLGIDVAGVVFYSELFPNHLRSKGVAAAICSMALTSLVYLQAASTAFALVHLFSPPFFTH